MRMGEGKKRTTEWKVGEAIVDPGNKVLFKASKGNANTKANEKNTSDFDIKGNFINVNTDASLESEKEKDNISLLSLLRKKLREIKTFTRFLITFKITNDSSEQRHMKNSLNELFKEQFESIKGIYLFINIYGVMFLEADNTKIIHNFLKSLKYIDCVKDVQILYFSEMNKQIINDTIYFYEYIRDDIKKGVIHEPCHVDEIWELYINMLDLSITVRNNKNKNIVFEKNEKVRLYLSIIQNMYEESAKQFVWSLQEFFSFFVEDVQLPLDEFTDDFLNF